MPIKSNDACLVCGLPFECGLRNSVSVSVYDLP